MEARVGRCARREEGFAEAEEAAAEEEEEELESQETVSWQDDEIPPALKEEKKGGRLSCTAASFSVVANPRGIIVPWSAITATVVGSPGVGGGENDRIALKAASDPTR